MNDAGTIQVHIDRITDFVNEKGRFSEPVVDQLNRLLYELECNVQVEFAKQKMIEKHLSDFTFKMLIENSQSNDVKQKMYEALLG